ncbi:hypothetical protein Anas_13309 [Armadillidium nasatum]|uniref:Uncharacterized protein n=1 Tax=Armadillidium nasatum TaxID=96803 RepID=A0A5N5TDI7_9CRUS|nr:hypothetical protein Anas_13309 [Armadillidium nasatum]
MYMVSLSTHGESSLYFSFPPESIKVIFKQKTIPKFDIKSKEKTILKGTELGSELDKNTRLILRENQK